MTTPGSDSTPDTAPGVATVDAYCPCCGEQRRHKAMLRGGESGTIYRCTACKLRRLLPLPDPVADATDGHGMYAHKVHKHDPTYERLVTDAVSGYLARLSGVGKRPYTVLDLGGGMGYYSRAFAHKGLAVTYLDRDPVSLTFARPLNDKAGVATYDEPVESFAKRPENRGRFDLVFFRHVIEHCHHPDAILQSIRTLCRPGGGLVLETDNNASLEHLLHPTAGPYWRGLYRDHYERRSLAKLLMMRPLAIDRSQTHYYAFRMSNLKALLVRTGWDVLESFDYHLGDPVFWPNEPAPGTPRYRRGDRLRGLVHTAMGPLQRRLGMGAGLAVFAQPHIAHAVAHAPSLRRAA